MPLAEGYDYEGHLVSAAKTGTTVTYKYDTQGRRIGKSINGVAAAKYVYNGDNLIEERDGTGNTVTAAYFYSGGIDQPVGVIKSGSAYFFQQDALGNVTALTDSNGSLVEQYTYDVYGKPAIKDGAGNTKTTPMTPFLFTGREYDWETGLYHYRARAYSPVLGRFLSRDPLKEDGGLNLYGYVGNSPVNLTDPTGKFPGYGVAGISNGIVRNPTFTVHHETPSNAQSFTSNGQTFLAPSGTNFNSVYSAGKENGALGMGSAIGHYGTFDFQRNSGAGYSMYGNNFYSQYTNASNYAVGVYMRGAGFTLEETMTIASLFAQNMSSNAGDPEQILWWINGWTDADGFGGICR